jgi:hypothetical protein
MLIADFPIPGKAEYYVESTGKTSGDLPLELTQKSGLFAVGTSASLLL